MVPVGSPTINTANARTPGSRACLNCGTAANRYQENLYIGSEAVGYFWGVALSWNGTPTQQGKVLAAVDFGGGDIWSLRLETNNTLRLYNAAGTAIGVATGTLSANTYYWVEVYFKSNTSGNGSIELRVNGASITTASPNMGQQPPISWRRGGIVSPGVTVRIDDEVCNDDTGGTFDSWSGDTHISLLKPISPDVQRSAGWLGGAAGTTNLYQALDNTPPVGDVPANSTDTTQIENAVGVLTNETFEATLAKYTDSLASGGAGMAATDRVVAVRQIGRAGNLTAATARTLGVKGQSNPPMFEETFSTISTQAIAEPAGWVTFVGAAYVTQPALGTNPTIRVRKASATTNNVSFDLLGYMVEWREVNVQAATPGGASAGGPVPTPTVPTTPTGATGGGPDPQGQGVGTPAPGSAEGSGAAPWAATSAPAGGAEAGGPGPSSSVAATPTPGGVAAGGGDPGATVPGSPGEGLAGGGEPTAVVPTSPGGGTGAGVEPSAAIPVPPAGTSALGGGASAAVPIPPAGVEAGGVPPIGASEVFEEVPPAGAIAEGAAPTARVSPPPGGGIGEGTGAGASVPGAPGGAVGQGSDPTASITPPPAGAGTGGVDPSASSIAVVLPGGVVASISPPIFAVPAVLGGAAAGGVGPPGVAVPVPPGGVLGSVYVPFEISHGPPGHVVPGSPGGVSRVSPGRKSSSSPGHRSAVSPGHRNLTDPGGT
jgi:hypothetical protein